MDIERLLGFSPLFELVARRVYYSKNETWKRLLSSANGKKQKNNQSVKTSTVPTYSKWTVLKDYINTLNIKEGDILIVHSSTEQLAQIGVSPKELLDYLFLLVGDTGTLVIPCFPLYNDKNYDSKREMYVYNPKRTICSTGLLPNLFLRTKGVIRSKFPWNTLAAKGPLAEEMMLSNLDSDLAHGKGSAWEFAMTHGAKILLLGVKSSHTTTMVHAAEDLLDEKWPVSDWYEKKTILLCDETGEREVSIRTRKQEWAKYNASWYRSHQFIKKSILFEKVIAGVNVGFIPDSKQMVDYIIEQAQKKKLFFKVPKRCYKNEK